jgi:excinuclease ABC subunit A
MTGNTLYLLDEPTTGLHFHDIEKLLEVIQRLVDRGNTVVVIEHNLDVIKCADWIIDVGPGAGAKGGEIVFAGSPEDLLKSKSVTAPYLADVLSVTATKKQRKGSVSRGSAGPGTQSSKSETEGHAKPNIGSVKRAKDQAEQGPVATEPWQVLGRRWHSLSKGFPDGQDPEWPLELVDRVLSLLETVAGEESIRFDSPHRVDVTPNGNQHAWVELETKTPESLKVTLAGPPEAIDEAALRELDVTGPIETSEGDISKVTLNLTQLKHARSRKLRSFLKDHLSRCDRA